MFNLLLVLLSISLMAATLYSSMNYLPGTKSVADDSSNVTRYGFVALEKAFKAATARAGGIAPAPTADYDGGIAANFSADYAYLPKTPKGYAWKYGFNGSDYYFCLYPATSGASQAFWQGFSRARRVLSDQQYFIVPGAEAACNGSSPQSSNILVAPTTYPATISMVYLVRYTPPPPAEGGGTGMEEPPVVITTDPRAPPEEGTVDGQPITQPSDA